MKCFFVDDVLKYYLLFFADPKQGEKATAEKKEKKPAPAKKPAGDKPAEKKAATAKPAATKRPAGADSKQGAKKVATGAKAPAKKQPVKTADQKKAAKKAVKGLPKPKLSGQPSKDKKVKKTTKSVAVKKVAVKKPGAKVVKPGKGTAKAKVAAIVKAKNVRKKVSISWLREKKRRR